jgi:hypothetical protein
MRNELLESITYGQNLDPKRLKAEKQILDVLISPSSYCVSIGYCGEMVKVR